MYITPAICTNKLYTKHTKCHIPIGRANVFSNSLPCIPICTCTAFSAASTYHYSVFQPTPRKSQTNCIFIGFFAVLSLPLNARNNIACMQFFACYCCHAISFLIAVSSPRLRHCRYGRWHLCLFKSSALNWIIHSHGIKCIAINLQIIMASASGSKITSLQKWQTFADIMRKMDAASIRRMGTGASGLKSILK